MPQYDERILKALKKGQIPKEVFVLFNNAFISLEQTGDYNLFDIKKLISKDEIDYYRLRKGKYRAIFTEKNMVFYVHDISKRSEVYKKWP